MADIHPFRGIHYNPAFLDHWTEVLCPPYDIIPLQLQQELYLKSGYNFIRLEHARELPQDTPSDNKYTHSAATLERWLEQGILQIDETPAIYLHDQYFTYQGGEYKRRGITVRVRLEEWDRKVVRPHEGTLSAPKGDRLSLLWTLQANTSPILTLFEDVGSQVSSLLSWYERNQPLLELKKAKEEGHTIWAITEPAIIGTIQDILSRQPLYIADGHHRYESALTYQRERRTASSPKSADEDCDYVMMTLVPLSDPGLLILPPHRLVRGIPRTTMTELKTKLRAFFEIEELPLQIPEVWKQADEVIKKAGKMMITLFGPSPDRISMLRLRDTETASRMMPYFHSDLYKGLDVSIVDHVILENLLGISSEEEVVPDYCYDRSEAIERVLAEEYQLALLLNPISAQTIRAIADIGDKMPRKSTYFYPKLPAGLLLNRLE